MLHSIIDTSIYTAELTKKEKFYDYTYWITNIKEQKHYIGVRSCNIPPMHDLGIKYFSSKTKNGKLDYDFLNEQKENPENWEYRIIGLFKSRKDALFNEIELHEVYNVGKNPRFYNSSKQTSIGFDLSGVKRTSVSKLIGKGRIIQQFYKNGIIIKEDTIDVFRNDGFCSSMIYCCCNGKTKVHHGFIFKYKDDENWKSPNFERSEESKENHRKGIALSYLKRSIIYEQINLQGNVVDEGNKQYFTQKGYSYKNINACSTGTKKFHKKYTWRKKDDINWKFPEYEWKPFNKSVK